MTTVQSISGTGETQRVNAYADFDALFLAEHSRLIRIATVICGDAEAAADCVADAFERAYVRWRKVGRLDDPAGWVRRVALNRAIDGQRRRRTGAVALRRLAGRAESSATAETDWSDAAAFHDSVLAAAVAGLSPQQRAVVALHYLEDVAVAEVAATLRLSEGAVKYHLHQARERLRRVLTEQASGTEDLMAMEER